MGPKKTKFRTSFIRNNEGVAKRGTDIVYGEIAIIALENAFVTANQIEAARRVISHTTKRTGKVWIRIFPEAPMTKKPANVRMGSGKGPLDKFVAPVQAGRVLFEMGGLDKKLAETALLKAAKKLPVLVKIIEK